MVKMNVVKSPNNLSPTVSGLCLTDSSWQVALGWEVGNKVNKLACCSLQMMDWQLFCKWY